MELVEDRLSILQLGVGRVCGGIDNNTIKTVSLPCVVFLCVKAGLVADE